MAINFKSSSPLVAVANTIVPIRASTSNDFIKAQNNVKKFTRFLDLKRIELEKQKLPEQSKIKKLANLDLTSSFGNIGSLLKNLASGALDVAGLVGNLFPIRGRAGAPKPPPTSGDIAKPKVKPSSGGLRLGGIRALGVANALFAGLDFATGLQEGESVGKSAAGAGGSLAGSLLGGAIGQALIPVPGLGFVLGSMAGGFLGGWTADRAMDLSEKQKARLKRQEQIQMSSSLGMSGLMGPLDKFDQVVSKFENFVLNVGNIMGVEESYEGTDEGGGTINPPSKEVAPYDGPIDNSTFNPLPNGTLSTREVGVRGGEYGANRSYGGHSGQDIGGLPPGSPVVAWRTGRISYIGSVEPGDTILEIDHGGGVKSRYKHVVPAVANGSIVYGGQQIAKLFAAKKYDEHLHFEVWKNGSHTNPMPYIKAAQKIPGPLSVERAKQNSGNVSGTTQENDVGVNLYPPTSQQQTPQPKVQPSQTQILQQSPSPTSTATALPMPMVQPAATQQKFQPNQYEYYPSYSQGQALVVDRPMIYSSTSGNSGPIVIPSGGNGQSVLLVSPSEGQIVNSFIKTILLTNLSSS